MIRRRPAGPTSGLVPLWAILAAVLLVPLYMFTAVFAVKSGIFRLRGNGLSDAQFKAVLAFVGTGLASIITFMGLVFTYAHNLRSVRQVTLETVVKGLDLIRKSDGGYAPKAIVGGALASLVQLGHPVIAMRTLEAAWEDDAVHPSTACWLIGEVLRLRSSNQSVMEAAALLRSSAGRLTDAVHQPGRYYWPSSLHGHWPGSFPRRARVDLALAVPTLILSQPKEWWGESIGSLVLLLSRAQMSDPDIIIRRTCAVLLGPLTEIFYVNENLSLVASSEEGSLNLHQISETTSNIEGGDIIGEVVPLYKSLIQWLSGEPMG